MDKLCNILTKDYNANILRVADPLVQNIFKDVSSKNKDGVRGKTVLMDLIYNSYYKTQPAPTFIAGPQSVTLHWSRKHQKTVYIFNEYHSNERESDCRKLKGAIHDHGTQAGEMSFETFILELLKTTGAFVDFFFEIPAYAGDGYTKAMDPTQMSYSIGRLLASLKTCTQYSTRGAKECRLGRVHYIDVRKINAPGGKHVVDGTKMIVDGKKAPTISTFRNMFQRIGSAKDSDDSKYEKFKKFFDEDFVQEMLQKIATNDTEAYNAFWTDNVFKNELVMKELAKSTMETAIRQFVERVLLRRITNERDKFKEVIGVLFNPKASKRRFINAFIDFYVLTMNINVLTMDVYTLSRIFRIFNTDRSHASISSTDQPREAQNVILYVGNLHGNLYRQFLHQVGFVEVAKAGVFDAPSVRCIDMTEFPQPFFRLPSKYFRELLSDGESRVVPPIRPPVVPPIRPPVVPPIRPPKPTARAKEKLKRQSGSGTSTKPSKAKPTCYWNFHNNTPGTDYTSLINDTRNLCVYNRNLGHVAGGGSAAIGGQSNAYGITLGSQSGQGGGFSSLNDRVVVNRTYSHLKALHGKKISVQKLIDAEFAYLQGFIVKEDYKRVYFPAAITDEGQILWGADIYLDKSRPDYTRGFNKVLEYVTKKAEELMRSSCGEVQYNGFGAIALESS
jgi:hypothetical protein